MCGLIKTARFTYLLLHSNIFQYDIWLNSMKKIQIYPDKQEKGGIF